MKAIIFTLFFTLLTFTKCQNNDEYPIPDEYLEELETYYESDYQNSLKQNDPDANRFCNYQSNSNNAASTDIFASADGTKTSEVRQAIPAELSFVAYIPLNPCSCKTLWCFIRAVHNLINRLKKYFLALAGLPCYLKKKILDIILDFYLRNCPDYLKKLIKGWIKHYIDKWC